MVLEKHPASICLTHFHAYLPYRQVVERAKHSAELEVELAQLRGECAQLRALLDDAELRLRSAATGMHSRMHVVPCVSQSVGTH